jgi:hypothetical protein
MNKTELAKLLIKHPEIKALYESRAFDTSTINKVIAEEIMNEQGGKDSFKKIVKTTTDRLSQPINLKDGQTISDWMKDSFEGTPNYENATDEERVYYNYILNALQDVGDDTDAAYEKISKMYNQDPPQQSGQSGATDGRVSQAALDTRAELDAEDSLDFRIDAEESFQTWKDELKAASDEGGVEKIVKDFTEVYNAIIKSYEETTTGLFDDSLKQAKREFGALKKLSNRAVARLNKLASQVAQTNDKEDDKAVVKAVVTGEPEVTQQIQSTVAATKEKDEDKIQAGMTAVKDAIAALAKQAQDDAKAANPDLDLSGIEIDDEGGSNDSSIDGSGKDSDGAAVIPQKTEQVIAQNVSEEVTTEKFPILLSDKEFVEKLLSLPRSDKSDAGFGPKVPGGDIGGLSENNGSSNAVQLMKEIEVFRKLLENPSNREFQLFDLRSFRRELFTDNIRSILATASGPEAIEIKKKQIAELEGGDGMFGMDDFLEELKEELKQIEERTQQTSDPEEATPEGTQAAVQAIESGNTNDVTNINSSDVDAAKKEKESEIEASPEMQANAEELKTKVEKNKMPNEKKLKALKGVSQINKAFEKAKADIEKRIEASKSGDETAMAQLPEMGEILSGPIRAMQETMETITSATSWDELAKAGIWSQAIKTRKEANQLPDFERWKQDNEKEIQDKYEELRGSLGEVDISSEEGLESVQDSLGDAAIVVGNAIQNSDASSEESGEDVGGAEVQGQTDLETISKILPELKDKLPNLFKFDGFVKNLAQALMNAEAGPDSDSTNDTDDADDAQGGETVLGTNLDSNAAAIDSEDDVQGIPEALSGIYLTEEEGVVDDTDEAGDEKTGKPLEVADAETLRKELEQLRQFLEPKNIKIEDLLTPELEQALGQEPTEETSEVPSVEEAAEEGQNAAQDDADQPDMKYQEMYAGFKEQMDEFFSLDGKNDGFMDQFLLKYQAKALSELLGTLDDIIRGDVPKDGEDNEGEARALSTATQQADNQLEEAQEQEISEKGQLELKTRLIAMLKGLKSLKAMMNSYKQNATRSSANPKLDGSALKKSLQRYMSNLQINIKAIVETCYIEHSKLTQTQSDDVDLNEPSGDDATQPTGDDTTQNVEDPQPSVQSEQLYEAILEAIAPALDGVYLMEDAAREEKMAIVNQTYEAMSKIYEGSMQSALERSQKAIAMKNAKDMMELAKKEEFVALFPTFVGSFGGKPQTINQATDAVEGLLKDFVETMKKVIVLAKGSTIDETTLSKVIEDLSLMSLAMQNYFGVKSLLDDDMQARVEKMLAQRAENQSLSDEAKPSNERSGGLLGKALEKLKQMFGWISDETQEMLDVPQSPPLPVFEPMAKLLDVSAIPDKDKDDILKGIVTNSQWFETLDEKQKTVVTKFSTLILSEIEQISERKRTMIYLQKLLKDKGLSGKNLMKVRSAFKKLEKEEQTIMGEMIQNNTIGVASYIENFLTINNVLGKDAAKKLITLPKLDAAEPTTNDLDASDDDGLNDEGTSSPADDAIDSLTSLSDEEKEKLKNYVADLVNAIVTSLVPKLEEEKASTDSRFVKNMMNYLKANSVYVEQSVLETFEKENPDFIALIEKALQEDPVLYVKIVRRVTQETSSSTTDTSDASDSGDASLDDGSRVPPSDTEGGDTGDEEGEIEDALNTFSMKPEDVERIGDSLKKYESSLGSDGSTITAVKDLVSKETAEKLGKDSIEVMASIIEIAKLIFNERSGQLDESLSKILNKIKKSIKSFAQDVKVKREFSKIKQELRIRLGAEILKKAEPYLMFLLKFIERRRLVMIMQKLEFGDGDIDYVRSEMKKSSFPPASSVDSSSGDSNERDWGDLEVQPKRTFTNTESLERSLKPIIEKMLKEHYNH